MALLLKVGIRRKYDRIVIIIIIIIIINFYGANIIEKHRAQ